MKIIAHIENDFSDNFGIPRQSGMVDTTARIVFEPEYRVIESVRGLSDFNYIWLLWDFSLAHRDKWSPTVRPPVLGGNKRMGVFATRSPYRPNNIGLSSVKLIKVVTEGPEAPWLEVSGADLLDGTGIYDIKPYIMTDCHPDAREGFNVAGAGRHLDVDFSADLLEKLPEDKRDEVTGLLSLDPRPSYQNDPERTYGMAYGGFDIRFKVSDGLLSVTEVVPTDSNDR